MKVDKSHRCMGFMMSASGNMVQSMSGDIALIYSITWHSQLLLIIKSFVFMVDFPHRSILLMRFVLLIESKKFLMMVLYGYYQFI